MTLLVMAAGMGSRYGGLKQIDPITENGEFIVDFSVYDAISAGFDEVVFVIKEENYDIFRDTIGKRIEDKIKVEYTFQAHDSHIGDFKIPDGREKPWGTGHAVLCAKDVIDTPFVVINADDFYGRDAYMKMAEFLGAQDLDDEKIKFCMAGYVLGKTLTEHGHVARGLCSVDENGHLTDVKERTKIIKTTSPQGAAYEENEGQTDIWIPVSDETIVSMNFWGFTPSFFPNLEKYFNEFLSDISNGKIEPLKSELHLPAMVKKMMGENLCDVSVLKTSASWYGVTYQDDKPFVVGKMKEMIDEKTYPNGMWK